MDKFAGDDWVIPITITSKKTKEPINLFGAEIKASVVRHVAGRTSDMLLDLTDVLSSTEGSDWSNGLIVVKFPKEQTELITKETTAKLWVQYVLNEEKTTLAGKELINVLISPLI